jgi:hypothetical protein
MFQREAFSSSSLAPFSSPQPAGFSAFGLHQQQPPQQPLEGFHALQLQRLQQLELQALQEKHYMQKLMLQQPSLPDTRQLVVASCTGGPIMIPLLPNQTLLQQQQQQVLLPLPSQQLVAAVSATGQVLHSYHTYSLLPGSAASSCYDHAAAFNVLPGNTGLGVGHRQLMQGSVADSAAQLFASSSGGAAHEFDRQHSSNMRSGSSSPGRQPAEGQRRQGASEWWDTAVLL